MRHLILPALFCLLVGGCSRTSLDQTKVVIDAQAECTVPRLDAGHVDDAGSPSPVDASKVDAAGAEACLVGGNVFHVEGDPGDPIYPGTATVTSADGTWAAMMAGASDVQVVVYQSSVTSWAFVFRDLWNVLEVKEYDNVTTVPTASAGPFLALYLDGRTCDQGTARVTFVTLDRDDPTSDEPKLLSLTATFEVHCGAITSALRGCVHYHP